VSANQSAVLSVGHIAAGARFAQRHPVQVLISGTARSFLGRRAGLLDGACGSRGGIAQAGG